MFPPLLGGSFILLFLRLVTNKYERICPLSSHILQKHTRIFIFSKNMKDIIVFVLTNMSKYAYVRYQRIYAEIRSY